MTECQPARTTKGLATLAMLKANYDAGRDHIDIFLPFVADVLPLFKDATCTAEKVRSAVRDTHALEIPEHAMQTLLRRCVKKGFLRREGGAFFIDEGRLGQTGLLVRRREAEAEQAELARAFRSFAANKNRTIESDDAALEMLLAFMEYYHVPLLLGRSTDPRIVPSSHLNPAEMRLVAGFISDVCNMQEKLRGVVQRMIEGFVLQNVAFLKDLGVARRRFSNLMVFFDTRFVFHVLGLGDTSNVRAARESFALLKDTGARTAVFNVTIREIKGILRVYEERLRTKAGTRTLHPTELTRHFLTKGYGPSDLKQVIVTLEEDLQRLGLEVKQIPAHVPEYTLNEGNSSAVCRGLVG